MSTRSLIGKENPDKSVTYIYAHWDGYPSYQGVLLRDHYKDPVKVSQLLALGDLSYLDESIEAPVGHTYDNPVKGYSVFYGRDRGETHVAAKTAKDKTAYLKIDHGNEYWYLLTNEGWFVSQGNGLLTLDEAIASDKTGTESES